VNRILLTLLWLLLAAGCASTAPVPEDRFYRLDTAQPPVRLPRPLLTGGLAVDSVQADPLHSGRAILFSERGRPLQLQRYHYEFWVDQPPRMVQQALVSWLRATGVADSVAGGDERAAAWRLSARLLKFEEVRDGSGAAHVEVAMQFTLLSTASDRPLWTRDYIQQQAFSGAQMYATAQAMQAALSGLFAELQADLATPAL
jgi:ABC-type uncharacterized transport system auxiliary subunit